MMTIIKVKTTGSAQLCTFSIEHNDISRSDTDLIGHMLSLCAFNAKRGLLLYDFIGLCPIRNMRNRDSLKTTTKIYADKNTTAEVIQVTQVMKIRRLSLKKDDLRKKLEETNIGAQGC